MALTNPQLSKQEALLLLKKRQEQLLNWLSDNPLGGYLSRSPAASEPIAWTALALSQTSTPNEMSAPDKIRQAALSKGALWLAKQQQTDGSVGVMADQVTPAWATSLAIKVWQKVDSTEYSEQIKNATNWAFAQRPWTRPKHENFGHDTMLEGWSWAADTHSWVEPTAFFVLAFQAIGVTDHARYKQAVAMLVDRMLPSGGSNYGNTIILGQELLQHLQPTGIVAWALANEKINDSRLEKTLDYLEAAVAQPTGIASLAYATLGLSANNRDVLSIVSPIDEAAERALQAGGNYKPALVALAIQAILKQVDSKREEPL